MIKVKLIAATKVFAEVESEPLALASHAALECYRAKTPKMGEMIDVKGRLFDVSHHTTLEHFYFDFNTEGIAVGDITLGLHLCSPFYNSDQRSCRFCSEMFDNPDIDEIMDYVTSFWPELGISTLDKILSYIQAQIQIYQRNLGRASSLAAEFIKKERPFASEKYIAQNARKIAQEQMRMFVPVIFPTGFVFTIDLTALIALWESAWSPSQIFALGKMVRLILLKYPELGMFFQKERTRTVPWEGLFQPDKARRRHDSFGVRYKPGFKLLQLDTDREFREASMEIKHPVDKLHFTPEMMDNSAAGFRTKVEISLATMGQDQRHRTIGRSEPYFTDNFYLPPILQSLSLEREAIFSLNQWHKLGAPNALRAILAPYGAMVCYKKRGSFNALAHEQAKRLDWCAQEEIFHLSLQFRQAVEKKRGMKSPLLKMFEPPCFSTGKCAEGVRYCGRDIDVRKSGNYFSERKV